MAAQDGHVHQCKAPPDLPSWPGVLRVRADRGLSSVQLGSTLGVLIQAACRALPWKQRRSQLDTREVVGGRERVKEYKEGQCIKRMIQREAT